MKFTNRESAFTLMELAVTIGINAIAVTFCLKSFMDYMKTMKQTEAKSAVSAELTTLGAIMEDEFRTSLADAGAVKLETASKISINRPLLSDLSKYQRMTYSVVCRALPAASPLFLAGLKKFPAPADCKVVDCAEGSRPVIERTFYPDFSSSTQATVTVWPKFEPVNPNFNMMSSSIAGTFCLSSPLSQPYTLAGNMYFYYVDNNKKVAVTKRSFLISKERGPSKLTLLPSHEN